MEMAVSRVMVKPTHKVVKPTYRAADVELHTLDGRRSEAHAGEDVCVAVLRPGLVQGSGLSGGTGSTHQARQARQG